ncbi:hypothetical protein XarjCFBP1022_20130 [Xanthomonas arboricola]|nr:hypothetical protein XarjCFBP1022_20130 [Xanthomonas arboricola]
MPVRKPQPDVRWRYSVKWSQPHKPCPDAPCLASAVVVSGAPCPQEVSAHALPGSGYAISIEFIDPRPPREWSPERRAATRKRNLIARVARVAPLFLDELCARELKARPDYFVGDRLALPFPKEQI